MPEYENEKETQRQTDDASAQVGAEVPSEAEQIEELKKWIAASDIFPRCRGRLNWSAIGILRATKPWQSDQPTTFAHPTWNSLKNEIRDRRSMENVMVRKLFTLREQGQEHAHEALFKALTDPHYVLPGELLPLEQRKPGVLLMFEPEQSLELLRWMSLLAPDTMIQHVVPEHKASQANARPDLRGWTLKVLDGNPHLKASFEKFRGAAGPRDIHALTPSKLFDFMDSGKKKIGHMDPRYLYISENNGPDYDFLGNYLFGFFFYEATQDEVLRLFSREEQEKLATWQFYYPSHEYSYYGFGIGLLPESRFHAVEKKYPSFCSVGASHGLRAMIMTEKKMVEPEFDYFTYRQDPQADPRNMGVMLRAPDGI